MTRTSAQEIEELYRRERVPLLRLAYLLTGSEDRAEEIVHDAFLAVWSRVDQLGNPGGYLRQVVVNGTRRHHRRRDVERRHPPTPPGPVLPPEVDETWDALWTLADRQRTALVLRFYVDLDVEAIARAMECRPGTAKSLIHRGLAALRQQLEER